MKLFQDLTLIQKEFGAYLELRTARSWIYSCLCASVCLFVCDELVQFSGEYGLEAGKDEVKYVLAFKQFGARTVGTLLLCSVNKRFSHAIRHRF